MAKIIFLCIVFELLSSCEYFRSSKSGSSGKESEDPKKGSVNLKEEDPLVKKGLPPDPGKAGEVTLLGIDSDGDGVRDDVQRWIFEKYHNDQPLIEKAMLQYSRDYQNSLRNIDHRENALKFMEKDMASYGCIDDVVEIIYGDRLLPNVRDIGSELQSIIDNTLERFKAGRILDHYYSGQVYTVDQGKELGAYCEFRIDKSLIKKVTESKNNLKKGK